VTLTLKYAGFNYVADVDGSYAAANSLSTMIADTASNSVALTVDYAIDPQTSTIYGDYNTATATGITETLANLTTTIAQSEADGLSVTVRPLIDFSYNATAAMLTASDGTVYSDGEWRAYYNPTDVATFFASYQSMIVATAQAAQAGGAQVFDIGTELDQLTGPQYQSYWTSIITAVRAVFTGQLTYSAINDDDLSPWQYGGTGLSAGTGDITTQVSFWNKLDYVAIDEYAAISDATNPTLQQLINGWEQTPTDPTTLAMTGGLSLIQYYENIAATTGKPLLFTELGYESAPDAASQPAYTSSNTYDPALQARLYQAFFDAWTASGNTSLKGVYIWNWEPNPATVGAGSGPNWTPQGNTAGLQAVDTGYSAALACYVAGTRIATIDGERRVEDLAIGQMLRLSGTDRTAPIIWLGHRHIDCKTHPDPQAVWPVRVRPGAFAPQMPRRDLWLSPEHAVAMDGALIPIRHLVNQTTITQEPRDEVLYFHIALPTHELLLAEGLPCESLLDTAEFDGFDNEASAPERLAGLMPCAPILTQGARLEAARAKLRMRRHPLGAPGPEQSAMGR